jgi:arylsulfatase A-like enzyme
MEGVSVAPVMMLLQLVTAAAAAAAAAAEGPALAPRHAVVMLIDDLGYGDTGHMGAEYETPTIDALALGGIRLNQSYVTQLCSPTRAALLTSRYSYSIGMDGNVLTGGDTRCVPLNVSTVGNQMQKQAAARTAFVGKYDIGYSSWACCANCRGFEYWLGYYGAAEDYYLHGSSKALDFHENYEQAPQYRGEYSTDLFSRKAIEWITNTTQSGGAELPTFLYLAYQAVHGPIEAPPGNLTGCEHIQAATRRTYCLMMQSLDRGIANVTAGYRDINLFDSTVWLFLADNGGMPSEGGFNYPLRGHKATVWEGGVRAQTFLHWTGFSAAVKGTVYGGLAHVTDWGVTLLSALGHRPVVEQGMPALDGLDLWDALTSGAASPRTEMLLSMRDADVSTPASQLDQPA